MQRRVSRYHVESEIKFYEGLLEKEKVNQQIIELKVNKLKLKIKSLEGGR